MEQINFEDFAKVEMRVGRVVEVEDFPEARKPAYKLTIDLGPEMGIKKSSRGMTGQRRRYLSGAFQTALFSAQWHHDDSYSSRFGFG